MPPTKHKHKRSFHKLLMPSRTPNKVGVDLKAANSHQTLVEQTAVLKEARNSDSSVHQTPPAIAQRPLSIRVSSLSESDGESKTISVSLFSRDRTLFNLSLPFVYKDSSLLYTLQ